MMVKLILSLLVLIPAAVFAQTAAPANYVPLADLPVVQTAPGAPVSLEGYIPGMFQLLIAVAGIIAVVQIVVGGVQYLSTDAIDGKKEGRSRIENAITGLVLAIAAWVILNTINPATVNLTLSIPSPVIPSSPAPTPACPSPDPCMSPGACGAGETCSRNPSPDCSRVCTPIGSRTPCAGGACYSQYPVGSAWPSDATERATLTGYGYTIVSSGGQTCTTVGQAGCTTVHNLGSRAMSGLQWLSQNCSGCALVITGGSEFWLHQSHGPGMNRVDLRYTAGSALDQRIRSGQNVGTTNGCYNSQPAWRLNGATYVLENGNHWHVCY